MITLHQTDKIPDGLLELDDIRKLDTLLPSPTLLHLEGERKAVLFISVLLHANEDTGFFAVQRLLRQYQERGLPRSLCIFFGNIAATHAGERRLEGQPDYNRVWPGTEMPVCDETRLMQEVVATVTRQPLFASIDVHNNTGKNPHYGCINTLDDPRFLQLAQLFSRTVVYFETPKGVQSMAFAPYCPAITIECGKPHVSQGVEHAMDYLDTVMHLDAIPDKPVHPADVDIYHTVARITVPDQCSFSFTDPHADLLFDESLDRLNFSDLERGAVLGRVRPDSQGCLTAWGEDESDISRELFALEGDNLVLNKPLMPAMLTLDEAIIRQDCLCYLMERIEY